MVDSKKIKWQVIDKYVAKSDDEHYRLIKGYIRDQVRYVPYYVDGESRTMLSNGLITVEAAKTVCEIHKKGRENAIRERIAFQSSAGNTVITENGSGKKE